MQDPATRIISPCVSIDASDKMRSAPNGDRKHSPQNIKQIREQTFSPGVGKLDNKVKKDNGNEDNPGVPQTGQQIGNLSIFYVKENRPTSLPIER